MSFNDWLIIFLIFIVLMLSYKGGYFIGNKKIAVKDDGHSTQIFNIQAGLMGLLGVMLAFSFSLSSQRFEQRRQLVIQESMNIGTAYFRAGLLPDTIKTDLRNLLKIYLDERIDFYKSGNTAEDLLESQKSSEYLHVQIWAKTAVMGKKSPNLNTNITILALNSMIDISGNISSNFQSHVPKFILILLIFISVCTVLIIGYSHGFSSDKNIFFITMLNIVLCSILLLIKDLDSPTSGFLKADVHSLIELKKEIQKYDR